MQQPSFQIRKHSVVLGVRISVSLVEWINKMTLELVFLIYTDGTDCSVFCIGDKELKPKAKAKYFSLLFYLLTNW